MSIAVMSAVWANAKVSGGTLVVLLAMSDYAHDDGSGVYPKQSTLAEKARMGERNLRNVLAALEENGYIERVGKRGAIVEWRVETDPAIIAVRNPIAGDSGTGVPTEPSTTPSEGEANASPSKNGRESGERYRQPATPGSAAAPWLVLELGRLMRDNDPQAKLPVGLRELMAPEYVRSMVEGGRKTPDARRELLVPVLDKPGLLKWLDEMRLLVDTDKRDVREVVQVLRWCQHDSFWKTNVLSAAKFRKQYPQLRARWREEGGSAGVVARRGPDDRGPTTREQLDALTRRREQEEEES